MVPEINGRHAHCGTLKKTQGCAVVKVKIRDSKLMLSDIRVKIQFHRAGTTKFKNTKKNGNVAT